jgi:hypothetical protein
MVLQVMALNGIQEVASSILVSSTIRRAPFPLVYDQLIDYLDYPHIAFISAQFH